MERPSWLVREVMTLPKTAPIMTATARSSTLPRMMKSLKSVNNFEPPYTDRIFPIILERGIFLTLSGYDDINWVQIKPSLGEVSA